MDALVRSVWPPERRRRRFFTDVTNQYHAMQQCNYLLCLGGSKRTTQHTGMTTVQLLQPRDVNALHTEHVATCVFREARNITITAVLLYLPT